jgi:hypothetical protein
MCIVPTLEIDFIKGSRWAQLRSAEAMRGTWTQ